MNPDKVITEDDVVLRTHKRRSGEFVDAKSKKFFEDYTARKQGNGGVVNNRLYGFGSLVPASKVLGSSSISSSTLSNGDFTQTKEFEDKLAERVEKMREEVMVQLRSTYEAQLRSTYEAKFEQMKIDFQLQIQEMVRNSRT